jgi:hypothetical protein
VAAVSLAGYFCTFCLAAICGIGVDRTGIAAIVSVGCAFLLIGALCTRFGMPRIRAGIECTAFGFMLLPPTILSTYLAIRPNMPLQDALLASLDAALGFDWHATIGFIDSLPFFATIVNFAYGTFSYQLVAWPLMLIGFGHTARAYQLVASFAVICFLSSIISIWTPAVGAYPYYRFDSSQLKNLDVFFGYYFLDEFNAARSTGNFVWSLTTSKGILTFPSVHAAVAFLCAWAAWPMRVLRAPAALLNGAMGVSAVTSGSHYAVDIVAGCAVAMISIACVVRISRTGRVPAATAEGLLPAAPSRGSVDVLPVGSRG